MNSVLVLHSKQAVRDDAATEGAPWKAGCLQLMERGAKGLRLHDRFFRFHPQRILNLCIGYAICAHSLSPQYLAVPVL